MGTSLTERYFLGMWHERRNARQLHPSPLDRFISQHLLASPAEFKAMLKRHNISCRNGEFVQGELSSIILSGECRVCGGRVFQEVGHAWQVGRVLEEGLLHEACRSLVELED